MMFLSFRGFQEGPLTRRPERQRAILGGIGGQLLHELGILAIVDGPALQLVGQSRSSIAFVSGQGMTEGMTDVATTKRQAGRSCGSCDRMT